MFDKRQHGQALVESVVGLTFVIVPLLFLLPFLSKLAGVQHRADQASHYSAWERTVWKKKRPDRMPSRSGLYVAQRSDAEQLTHIPWRFYQGDGQPITSRYKEQWSWQEKAHPLLKYPVKRNGQQSLLLSSAQEDAKDDDELDRLTGSLHGQGTPGFYGKSVEKAVNMLSFTGFKLPDDQFYRTSIHSDIENLNLTPFESLDLSIDSQSALLASGWNAAGPYHVRNRVKRLVLTNYMDVGVIRTAQRLLGIIPFGRELKPSRLKLGFVEPDALPNNRLCTYGTKNCGG